MCTVTAFYWPQSNLAEGPLLTVTMNRDEAVNRPEGVVQHKRSPSGDLLRWFPTDAATGGTWFGVGCAGLVFALLNRYQDSQVLGNTAVVSRGAIIPRLLQCRSTDEVAQHLSLAYCGNFSPFDLLVFIGGLCHQFSWNGKQLEKQQHAISGGFFYTSSSINMAQVLDFRSQQFRGFVQQYKYYSRYEFSDYVVSALHSLQGDNPSYSINMMRSNRQTRSICQVRVAAGKVECDYWPLAIKHAPVS
ncbi:NRDE family protein [Marinagarivorans cellulosilyticus]|uniref:Uncharacterized protein n=1 Tax=Marinagarivorans cellulosilyticus TaxID=2721545 RepID=A0AAN1WHC1_9GAMM|nr:NRDE family protein [Marinagarivorans cellulosilyticus]BCD97614.1 hypothetical protein MARGE09_P1815 [Marinagarivorans cellulosilyticus]